MPKLRILDTEGRWNPENEDEWLWWPRVLWIDPGVVSGVAVMWFDPFYVFEDEPLPRQLLAVSELYFSGPEYGVSGQINRYIGLQRLLNQQTGLATGVESFRIRQMNSSEEFLAPVRIRAGIEARMSIAKPLGSETPSGIPLFSQSPNDAKTTFTNDRLKQMRLYTEGPDHLNDVKRHCLLWIRKLRQAGPEFFYQAHGDEEGWWTDHE